MGNKLVKLYHIAVREDEDFQAKKVRPVIVVGDFNSGKTWLCRHLIKRLKGDVDNVLDVKQSRLKGKDVFKPIAPGRDKHTEGADLYEVMDSEIMIYDTEGLKKSSQNESKSTQEELYSFVLALTSSVRGMIIYMTTKFDIDDEVAIQALCNTTPLNHKILVVHNYLGDTASRHKEILTDVSSNSSLHMSLSGTNLSSDINARSLDHIMLFKHNDSYEVAHNTRMFDRIINFANHVDLVDLSVQNNVLMDKIRRFNSGQINLSVMTEMGEVRVFVRPLMIVEEDEFKEDYEQMVAIEVSGPNLKYLETTLEESKGVNLQNLHTLTITDDNGRVARAVIWLPHIIVRMVQCKDMNNKSVLLCYGRIMRMNGGM
jgi:GTPase SAR1 family protein